MARAGLLQRRKPARTSQDPSHGAWEVLSVADEVRKASVQSSGLPPASHRESRSAGILRSRTSWGRPHGVHGGCPVPLRLNRTLTAPFAECEHGASVCGLPDCLGAVHA